MTTEMNEAVENIRNKLLACCIDEKSKKPIPLNKIGVQVNINGFVASVESSLTFENKGDKQLEAVFRFPIDDSSAVYSFEAELDGRKTVAECQEKNQAKEAYNEAIQSGHTATLLEEEDLVSDICVCKIGNLLPQKSAIVKFSYVTDITIQDNGLLKYTLPTLLNPRYNPAVSKGGLEKSIPLERVPANDQPYEFDVSISICGLDVENITSQKDTISSSVENGNTVIKLENKFIADHDFEIEISVKEPFKPFAVIEKGSKDREGILQQDVVMVNFFPQLDESSLPNQHEFLFVVDRSGSMRGSRIESAKESLLLFLKSLPQDCYFNIIGFGSNYELLFKEGSEKYTKESLEKALQHQQTLTADLRGTKILEPLAHIYSKPFLPTHSRNIFLITDGEVFNTKSVVSLVQKHSHDTRVFTLGIGEGASTALIKGVARAGEGKAEFVKSDDEISSIVIKLLRCAIQSTFTDVKIDWQLNGSNEYVQVPKIISPIFNNDHLIVYALLKGFSGGMAILTGKIGEKSYEFPLSFSDREHGTENADMPIHRMAAKAEILRLQDTEEKESNKSAIILLSIASNVISRYTALVGIDKVKNEIVVEDMITCLVPTMQDLTLSRSGFARFRNCTNAIPSGMMCSAPTPKRFFGGAGPCLRNGGGFSFGNERTQSYLKQSRFNSHLPNPLLCGEDIVKDEFYSIRATEEVGKRSRDNFIELIYLQSFDGNWSIDDKTCALLNLDKKKLLSESPVNNHDVWATILVLTFFRKQFTGRRGKWERIESKALKWLSKQNLEGTTKSELFDKAKETLH